MLLIVVGVLLACTDALAREKNDVAGRFGAYLNGNEISFDQADVGVLLP